MADIIQAPSSVALTEAWHEIQKTNLYMYQRVDSHETNQLLKALGRGSYFVVKGFKLALFKTTINGLQTCVARLTPGILVQDFTVIDFIQPLKELKQYIYVKVFDENDEPHAGQIFKIGSRYYHGTIGDGIQARPTYSTISAINLKTGNTNNFKTLYRLTLTSSYNSSNNNIIDLNNIIVDDFRFNISSSGMTNSDPTDEKDDYFPSADQIIDDTTIDKAEELDEESFENLQTRSSSLMWSIVMGNAF